jgi:hypothetical protein
VQSAVLAHLILCPKMAIMTLKCFQRLWKIEIEISTRKDLSYVSLLYILPIQNNSCLIVPIAVCQIPSTVPDAVQERQFRFLEPFKFYLWSEEDRK